MQMLEITDTGVKVPTLDEIIEAESDGYKGIYGQDIVITPNSPDGQRIGLESQARKDAYDTLAYAIQMHDPQYAACKFCDVIRPLAYSILRINHLCGISKRIIGIFSRL